MMKKQLELLALHNVLINMAANDELPLDITQLDMFQINKVAMQNLSKDSHYKRTCMIEMLQGVTCFDTFHEASEALDILLALRQCGRGEELADWHISIVELFENKFTVNEILDFIS